MQDNLIMCGRIAVRIGCNNSIPDKYLPEIYFNLLTNRFKNISPQVKVAKSRNEANV